MILKFSLHYPLILSSIHFHIVKITVVSPLHDIYCYVLYDTRMMLKIKTDTCINVQIKSMIVVLDLNHILVSA